MSAHASARPARLLRFEGEVHTIAEAMQTRARLLDTAITSHHASCDWRFRTDLRDLPPALRASLDGLAALGTWTGDVGRAFATADAIALYVRGYGQLDPEDRTTADETDLLAYLDGYDDPYLGAPAVGFPPGTGDPTDEPPSWIDLASGVGDDLGVVEALLEVANLVDELPTEYTVHVIASTRTIQVLSNGVVVETLTEQQLLGRALVPGVAPAGRVAFVRWAARGGHALSFVTEFATSHHEDRGSGHLERIVRAGVRGAGVTAGAAGGAYVGAQAGAFCGPAAWVCVPAGGLVGGILGGLLSSSLLDWIPFLRPDEPLPLDHDLDAMGEAITGAGLSPIDEIAAWEAAAAAVEEDALRPGARDLVDELATALEIPRVTPVPPPPTGTTTTTLPPAGRTAPPTPTPVPGPAPTAAPPTDTPPTGTTVPHD